MDKITISADRLTALKGEVATFSKADYDSALANKHLAKISGDGELVRRILENALVEESVRKSWKAVGEQIASLYARGEVYDPNFQDALTDLVYLAMPADVKLAYRLVLGGPKKAHVVDSPADAAKRKLRRAARQRVSNTVKTIINAAYPKLTAKKSPSEEADEEKDAEAELAAIQAAAEKGGSPYVEEAREDGRSVVSSGASSRMDEDEEEEEDETGGIAPPKAAGGDGRVARDAERAATVSKR